MPSLVAELERIAARAAALAPQGFELATVLAAEPASGARAYVCGFVRSGERAWLVVREDGTPIGDRQAIRDAAAIAALCELATESAFPGDLAELIASLRALAESEAPQGIEQAIEAAQALQELLAVEPALASPARLDAIGAAARRLETELSEASAGSPFSAAMRSATRVVDDLVAEVERTALGGPGTPG